MMNRINYYTSRKNLFTWLAAIVLAASAVIRIIAGADAVWSLVVLPVFAALLLAFIVLLDGADHFYRSAIPVLLLCLYFGISFTGAGYSIKLLLLYWIACIAVAYFYWHMTSGHARRILCLIVTIAILCVKLWLRRGDLTSGLTPEALAAWPDVLVILGVIFTVLAMEVYLDSAYHPTWGDRSDGRRIRGMAAMTQATPYIMPTRGDAANNFRDAIEITELEKYIIEKRKEGYKGLGITHVFLAAYVRCIAKYPAINRFCSGQQVFTRGDDIQFCMVVKTSMSIDADESIMKLHLKPTDTVFDVFEKFNAEVERIKTEEVGGSDFDKVEKLFSLIPRLVLRLAMRIIIILDYFGCIPKFLLEISPFHGSVFFTSMASIGIPPVVHHLYNFGNLPVFICLGAKRTEYEPDPSPLVPVHKRNYLDYTINCDERICDGFYYAQVSKYLKKLLAHPEVLEVEPEEVKKDIE